jgi:peptidoglycan/xylan/chitin deacetylase (PgdA/CDA1 family)
MEHAQDMGMAMRAGASVAVITVALAGCGNGPAPGSAAGRSPGSVATAAAVTPESSPAATAGRASPGRPSAEPGSPRGTGPAAGPAPITGRLAGTDWTYIPTTRHVVALTFDAGANADAVASILATLHRGQVPATFFLTGTFARDYPAAARSIAAAGMRIGDHTISHPYLTRLSDAAVRQEILGGAHRITAVTGANPAPLFRFPFGDADARTITIANGLGYVPVRWTVDTLGWEGTSGGQSARTVVSRVLAGLRPGEIVLMHVGANPKDHTTLDADALPLVITELRARGYSFVNLGALVG